MLVGSGEGHMAYIYKRSTPRATASNPIVIEADPVFADAVRLAKAPWPMLYESVKKVNDAYLNEVMERNRVQRCIFNASKF